MHSQMFAHTLSVVVFFTMNFCICKYDDSRRDGNINDGHSWRAPRENSSFLLLRNRFRFLQFDRSSQIELSIKEILVRLSKERKRVETKRV